jgi:hypothetical protein
LLWRRSEFFTDGMGYTAMRDQPAAQFPFEIRRVLEPFARSYDVGGVALQTRGDEPSRTGQVKDFKGGLWDRVEDASIPDHFISDFARSLQPVTTRGSYH